MSPTARYPATRVIELDASGRCCVRGCDRAGDFTLVRHMRLDTNLVDFLERQERHEGTTAVRLWYCAAHYSAANRFAARRRRR